jgi:hypothetical protein
MDFVKGAVEGAMDEAVETDSYDSREEVEELGETLEGVAELVFVFPVRYGSEPIKGVAAVEGIREGGSSVDIS